MAFGGADGKGIPGEMAFFAAVKEDPAGKYRELLDYAEQSGVTREMVQQRARELMGE